MASDDMPDAAFTHTVHGFFGEELTIGAYPPEDPDDGGAVQFLVRDENGKTALAHISSPRERESFARAWMEACRIADGEKPATAEPASAACPASHPESGMACTVKGLHDEHGYVPFSFGALGPRITWTDADTLAYAIRNRLPVTLVDDEIAAAAGAVDAARDAREAWNDPDAY